MSATNITPSIFDNSGLAAIKLQARNSDPAALKAAAQQFEALFLQMVLKSMRDATPRDGMFDSDQTRLYESLLDQQMSQVLATRGGKGGTGLAAMIESQLSRHGSVDGVSGPDTKSGSAKPLTMPTIPALPISGGKTSSPAAASAFIDKMAPYAADASRASGIPAQFLVAQAALETGWGRSELRQADGQSSYNVFGVKAGQNWNGATVDATTTEYVDGVAQQRIERFRAYGSYAEAFKDYVSLLAGNPRYAAALGNTDATGFAQGLARAGYATDPAYAEKLTRIINNFPSRTSLVA
jgi:peptidoglycan hydrolase FlgJ